MALSEIAHAPTCLYAQLYLNIVVFRVIARISHICDAKHSGEEEPDGNDNTKRNEIENRKKTRNNRNDWLSESIAFNNS